MDRVQHRSIAHLEGTFVSWDHSNPRPLSYTTNGTPFIRFAVELSEPIPNVSSARSTCSCPAVAWGALAQKIDRSFYPGDSIALSGVMHRIDSPRMPLTEILVRSARQGPEADRDGFIFGKNVAQLVGTVCDATPARLRDGTPVSIVTLETRAPDPAGGLDRHTVVLQGRSRDDLRSVNAGDTIAVNGSLRLECLSGKNIWAVTGANLEVLRQEPDRMPLRPVPGHSLER